MAKDDVYRPPPPSFMPDDCPFMERTGPEGQMVAFNVLQVQQAVRAPGSQISQVTVGRGNSCSVSHVIDEGDLVPEINRRCKALESQALYHWITGQGLTAMERVIALHVQDGMQAIVDRRVQEVLANIAPEIINNHLLAIGDSEDTDRRAKRASRAKP